ncbi:unnamed protein product [Nippostrongylus brasiliensis]|uniref:Serpentine receptor class gamma (inferred by orthology to a C. elegans protein) n=1 Tax=Nippostrongylus brasiliensis TaxID=27835 RepID=A0A158R3E9_NIPBR|nr:unnamed protein product [Nippostrongylus brasiliensis]
MGDLLVNFGPTSFMCILYLVLGSLSILCNILNLTIWMSSRDLRQKGLALLGGYLSTPITVRQCFQKYWPHSLILGTELPSFAMVLIALERLCAVLRPAAYNRFFTGRSKVILLSAVPLASVLSVGIGGLSIIGSAGDVVVQTQHCAIINSTARWYSTFHFTFIVLAYVVSFISIFTVWRISKRFSKGKVGGDNRMGVMLAITGSSIILVASESVVMMLIRWNICTFSDMVVAITYGMPAYVCSSLFM